MHWHYELSPSHGLSPVLSPISRYEQSLQIYIHPHLPFFRASIILLTPGINPTWPETKTMGPAALMAWLYGPTAPGARSVLTTSLCGTEAMVVTTERRDLNTGPTRGALTRHASVKSRTWVADVTESIAFDGSGGGDSTLDRMSFPVSSPRLW